jgi:hypothetical protein
LNATQAEFDAAQAALAAGDLGGYQLHIRNAQTDFAAYKAKLGITSSTTLPGATATTSPSTRAPAATTPTTGAP